MILPWWLTVGITQPVSHPITENSDTPRRSATSRCRSPSSSRRTFRCSPTVLGPSGKAPGFRHLRVTRVNGRKATQPCKCGWRLSEVKDCRCDDGAVARYTARMSGPLLDRIDLHVQVPGMRWKELAELPPGDDSATVRARVFAARSRQIDRSATAGAFVNARIPDGRLDALARPTPAATTLLARAVDSWSFSARALRRSLRVALTIADLARSTQLEETHVAEALGYRRFDPTRQA